MHEQPLAFLRQKKLFNYRMDKAPIGGRMESSKKSQLRKHVYSIIFTLNVKLLT